MSTYTEMEDDELKALIISDHLRKKRNADTWAPEQEAIIISWGEKAEAFRWMHHRAAVSYRATGGYLIYSSIAFSFVAGLLSLATASKGLSAISYVISALTITSAALTSFEQFERPTDKAGEHEQAADNFAAFFRAANLELSLNPEERRAFLDYLQLARADYEKLVTTSPSIPDKVIDEYRERFKDRRNQPEVVAADIGLEINMKAYRGKDEETTFTPDEYVKMKQYFNQKFGTVPPEIKESLQAGQADTDREIADLEAQIREVGD